MRACCGLLTVQPLLCVLAATATWSASVRQACLPGSVPASWPVLGWCSLLAALLARSACAGLPACRFSALLCTQLPPHRHLFPLRPHLPNLCSLRLRSFQPACCNGRPAGLPPAAVGGCLHEGKCRHTRPARQQAERGARPLQQAQQRHAPGTLAEAAWEHGVKHAARRPALEARIKTANGWTLAVGSAD